MSEPGKQSEPRYVVCHCLHCDGHIEFDANELAEENSIVPCPHCGLETKISVPVLEAENLPRELPSAAVSRDVERREGFFCGQGVIQASGSSGFEPAPPEVAANPPTEPLNQESTPVASSGSTGCVNSSKSNHQEESSIQKMERNLVPIAANDPSLPQKSTRVKGLPHGGTVSMLYFLPPFARSRLYTYPLPSQPGDPVLDCHWSTFNFSSIEPDMVSVCCQNSLRT